MHDRVDFPHGRFGLEQKQTHVAVWENPLDVFVAKFWKTSQKIVF